MLSFKDKNPENFNEKGFTLPELLLYSLMAFFVATGTGALFFLIGQSKAKSQAALEVEWQGAQITTQISQAIRSAEGINDLAKGANDSSLSVDVVDGTVDPTIFNLSGGNVQVKEGGNAVILLNNSRVTATNLVFSNFSQNLAPDSVRFEFTLNYNNPENRNEFNYSKTFYGAASVRK